MPSDVDALVSVTLRDGNVVHLDAREEKRVVEWWEGAVFQHTNRTKARFLCADGAAVWLSNHDVLMVECSTIATRQRATALNQQLVKEQEASEWGRGAT